MKRNLIICLLLAGLLLLCAASCGGESHQDKGTEPQGTQDESGTVAGNETEAPTAEPETPAANPTESEGKDPATDPETDGETPAPTEPETPIPAPPPEETETKDIGVPLPDDVFE